MLENDLKKSECQRKRWARRRIIIDEIARVKKARTTSAEAVVEALDRYIKREKLSIAKLPDRIVQARRSDDDLLIW